MTTHAKTPQRYNALWVSLHWLVAILIFTAFYLGIRSEDASPADKLAILKLHMPLGLSVLGLMIVRLIVRWRSAHPAPASSGNALLDKLGEWTHWALYVFAFLVPLTGVGLSMAFNLAPVVFGGQGELPANLSPLLHGLIDPILALLILLHVAAALWHQLVRKDNLLARMWFGS